jgi:hypothetical protein
MEASFARVQSGIEGIVSTSERLNHGEHRGGTEDTGESATADLEDWHSRLYPPGEQSTIFVWTGIESCLETGVVQIGAGQ